MRNEAYDNKADVYSFGLTLLEMLIACAPWSEQLASTSVVDIAFKVSREAKRPTIPESVPVELRALIIACWDQDAVTRPSMAEVMATLEGMGCVVKAGDGNALSKAPTPFNMFRAKDLRSVKCGQEPNDRVRGGTHKQLGAAIQRFVKERHAEQSQPYSQFKIMTRRPAQGQQAGATLAAYDKRSAPAAAYDALDRDSSSQLGRSVTPPVHVRHGAEE